jgi:hypothetical protein
MKEIQVAKLQAARLARAAHVAAWRESGLTQAAYCATNDLNAATFSGWIGSQRKPLEVVKTKAASAKPNSTPNRTITPKLNAVPIVVRGIERADPHTTIAPPAITLRCVAARWQLDISAATDPRWVGALLREMSVPGVTVAVGAHTSANP